MLPLLLVYNVVLLLRKYIYIFCPRSIGYRGASDAPPHQSSFLVFFPQLRFSLLTTNMKLPDIENLVIHDTGSPAIPEDVDHATDHYMQKLKNYAKNLPYSIEPNSKMQELLDFILLRITQCVEAKDYDPGLLQWDILFT